MASGSWSRSGSESVWWSRCLEEEEAWWWRRILAWSSWTKGVTEGSRELRRRTSWAVMMALMCSKLMTMALSRPRRVEGYERRGSNMRRSRAGRPVRRMMACFPASTTSVSPFPSSSSHCLTPVPFFRIPVAVCLSSPPLISSYFSLSSPYSTSLLPQFLTL